MPTMPVSRTLPAFVDELALRFPDREVIVDGAERYTYARFREAVRAFSKGLHALGVRRGDKVAILMANHAEWIIADFAICSLGAVMVGLNTWVTARELKYLLTHSDTRMLITSGRFLKYDYTALLRELEPHAENLPLLRTVVQFPKAEYPGALGFDAVYDAGRDVPDAVIDEAAAAVGPEDVSYILYTSGSTSTPKGVQLQHYALIENMWHIGERMGVTEHDRCWLAVSLFWGLGCENALFNLMTHGGCIVLQESFEPGEAMRLIQDEKCTIFYGTPNMVQAMDEHPDRSKYELSTLRTGGTIGTPEQLMRLVRWGATEFCHIYGLTETYGNCAVTDRHDPLELKLKTVGRALPGVDLRIVDEESGKVLGPHEIGEIRVKGYVTVGYYKDEEKNRAAFDAEGYFRTGDLAFLDEAGNIHFRGRSKEMIKTGGINVSPAEVEQVLMEHPAVQMAYVVGVPDAVRDEVIGAVVIKRPDAAVSEADLDKHCREALAAYKMPRRWIFVDETKLPLTVTGKLQKNRLHELFGA